MPESLSALWTSDALGGTIDAGPYVAGDRIVLASRGTVFAFDVDDGTRVPPSAGGTGFPYVLTSQYGGDPLFTAAGGFLYFADGTSIVALRLGDGTPSATWSS